MTQYTVNLLNWRLSIELRKKRGRAKKTPFSTLYAQLRRVRSGNKLSWVFRHILERSNIKKLLGGNLAFFVMVSGILSPGSSVLAQNEPEVNTLTVPEQPLSTEISIQYPVDPVILNQGYHLFHFGIDLDGVTGQPIYPIKKGQVEKTEFSRWAFGNSILIDHKDGLKSFYAHLSKVTVEQGQEVDTRTVIGEMGSTGRSTGDHLHLETYKNGRVVNPRTILGR